MEFWHMAFVAGTATFSIPVVIHLIFRMRKKRIVFSSLRFLEQSVLRQTSKLRLRELLLLLLRCAACIAIALAFARPYRPNTVLAGPSGRPSEDVVMILDDTPSVLAQESGRVRWQALLDRAQKEVGAHHTGDRVALIYVSDGSRAEIELSNNFGALKAALDKEKTLAKRGDLTQALNTGLDMLAQSTQLVRRVVIYSDLQSTQIDRGALAEAARKAAATGRGVQVQFETPAGVQPEKLSNFAITDVRAKSDVWIENRPVPFAIRIANHGETENASLPVRLLVDGKVVATRTVGLGPRSSTEIELSAPFAKAGEASGQVEIDGRDALPEDDKRYFALRLRDSLRVLVIEDRLGDKDAFLDEGYYVRMALDPKARGERTVSSGKDSGQSYVQVQSVATNRVLPEMLRSTDLIVLVGVNQIAEKELATLEEVIRAGKNLVIFAGRSDGRLNEAFYNGAFWKDGKGLLPAKPGPIYEGNQREGKYHQLGEFKAEHTLFKTFTGENEPNLRLPRYVRHHTAVPGDLKLGSEEVKNPTGRKLEEHELPRPVGEVLATFGDGSPMVMERPFGKGNVLMFNFAPRPEATDLPKRKAFVPLMHQTVRHLAVTNSASRRNLLVGEQFDFSDAGATPDVTVVLQKPGVKKDSLSLVGKDHPEADVVGFYTAAFQLGNVKENTRWAANFDPRESDLKSEDLASLRSIFASNTSEGQKTGPIAGNSDTQWNDEQKSQAPEWRYFLVAAVLFLLLEVWLRDYWS